MLRVPIGYAEAGMVLAMPIYHPRRQDTMLLKAGMVLDVRTVERLQELRIREFWIRYPGFEFVGEYICPEVQAAQALVTRQMGEAFDAVSAGTHAKLDYSGYRSAIGGLLSQLVANPKAALFVQEMADRSDPVLRHGSSVCMLSVLMGLKLEDYLIAQRTRMHIRGAKDVAGLGLAAMLHDVGMLRLSAETIGRWERTQDESDPEFQQHVWIGFRMVREAIGPAAASAVLHHHQRYDGSGFPKRKLLDGSYSSVEGRKIHIYARIIAAADLFDRLRYAPGAGPEEAAAPVVRALRRMMEHPHCSWVDPMVMRALLAVAPAYAPGSMVRLSTGEDAVVVECFADHPCRPSVRTIGDVRRDFESGPAEPRQYNLVHDASVSIVEAEGQDVSRDNFVLPAQVAAEVEAMARLPVGQG
jgi:HD-GYP domain-containing protein (c-di-GMP phosphodiesterase class II)